MQITDSNGNVYGWDGLEINGPDGKAKVPVINTDITIGTTAIVGGVVGRVLFQGTGNVVQESPNITWDDTNKIFKVSTGTNGIVLEGDASGYPTFKINTLRSGTTRRNWMFATEQINAGDFVLYRSSTGGGIANTLVYSIFNDGNFGLNTSTNAGYKADINGTLRVQSSLVIANPAFTNGGTIAHTANSTLYITGGPGAGGENITFGPSNRIFINAQQTRFPNGSVQMSSTLTVGSGNATSTNMLLMQGSITAGSALGRGIGMDTTLVAAANNDVLVGLDVKPTFNNNVFTGVKNLSIRVGNSYAQYTSALLHGVELNTNVGILGSLDLGGDSSVLYLWRSGGRGNGGVIGATYTVPSFNHIYFGTPSQKQMVLSNATGNLIIQTGGTFTDAGFKLDVNGTARATGVITGYQFNASYNGGSYSAAGVVLLDYGDGLRIGYSSSVQKITLFTAAGTPRFQVVNSGSILIGTTTEIASSLLTLNSSTRGFLPPRMTTTEKNAISTPAAGLVIFDTTLNKLCVRTAAAWETITSI